VHTASQGPRGGSKGGSLPNESFVFAPSRQEAAFGHGSLVPTFLHHEPSVPQPPPNHRWISRFCWSLLPQGRLVADGGWM
jgi:hypothetical protein